MFVAMGITSPWAGRLIGRSGPRRTMAAGATLIGASLCLVARSTSAELFLLGWGIVGVAGAMFLTTAAYAYLAEHGDQAARGMIGSLMLVTGLAGSVFWPVTAFLFEVAGWRMTILIYAGGMTLLVAPALYLGLPDTARAIATTETGDKIRYARKPIFILVVVAIALNSFVTFGIDAIGIELFRALGSDLASAVAVASLLGIFKVGGRLIDVLGGRNWDGLSTALVSGIVLPLGLLAIALGGKNLMTITVYLCLFGLGSGAFAVARATMPLVFFSKADYAAAMSAIALPMHLINALAPPALAAVLVHTGPTSVLSLLAAISAVALLTLCYLKRMQGQKTAGQTY
ncbi:MFS permease [Stappia aggregata IAM 12614]|uniref:MFS permease n=2 Tax=Roseibium aggregatum TaxID=187304 RepID=A0NT66_ROSAI|nr:MFS permease [Stappia aggregata IAM 12614] [Roseibium aggregatum IAM 12614]